jgi:hypothetical protein
MITEEDFNYSIKYIFKSLKEECLFIVKEYRKIIFSLDKPDVRTNTFLDVFIDRYNVDSFCKIIDGQVDEEGKIFITSNIKQNFENKIKQKCLEDINYYALFVTKFIDVFIEALVNFKNPILTLSQYPNSKQLRFLYECWFGEIYPNIKHFDAIIQFTEEIKNKRTNINETTFNHLFYESQEVTPTDPIEDISSMLDAPEASL